MPGRVHERPPVDARNCGGASVGGRHSSSSEERVRHNDLMEREQSGLCPLGAVISAAPPGSADDPQPMTGVGAFVPQFLLACEDDQDTGSVSLLFNSR